MIRNNKELRQGLLLFAVVTVLLSIAGWFHSPLTALLVFLGGAAGALIYFLTEYRRYRKLEKLSAQLERLMQDGTSLSIADYEEGELSVLASQLQKVTLRLKENAEALSRDKRFLADSLADISHQLRTPLTTMNLTLGLLKNDPEPAEREELLREFSALLSRTEWLVETLLKLSRLDAGMVPLSPGTCTAGSLFARSSEPLLIPMELKEQTLTMEGEEIPLTVDPVWIAEAIGNILKNCVEHTPAGGTIRLSAEDNPLYTAIVIEDDGPGFAGEDLPHLFERFYKGKNGTSNGYGIGLALAQKIITAQGGTIQASNGENGACFTIRFYKTVM